MSGWGRRLPIAFCAIYVVSGIFWLLVAGMGEGSIQLIGVGILSLITASLLRFGRWRSVAKAFVVAVGLYNLVLYAYLTYTSTTLLAAGLILPGAPMLIGYLIATLIFLAALIASYTKPEYVLP